MKVEEFHELTEQLEDLKDSLDDNDSANIMTTIGALLEMPDEQFEAVAPGILGSFLQRINKPGEKIALTQALNAQGYTADELTAAFIDMEKGLSNLDNYSEKKKDFLKQIVAGVCNAIQETEGIAKRTIRFGVEFCHPDAKMPEYAHLGDSGMDVFALEDYAIKPGETSIIPTGLKFMIPPGFELQVRPKSGRTVKTKLRVANTPGTVDASYRGEVGVIVENIEAPIKDIKYKYNDDGKLEIKGIDFGSTYYIGKGEKFAQLVLMEVPKAELFQIEKVDETDRGAGAYGSTGF